MREGKGRWFSFPIDYPIRSGSPPVAVNEEREVSVVEKEFAIEAFDGDGTNVFASDEVQGGVGMVKERLSL